MIEDTGIAFAVNYFSLLKDFETDSVYVSNKIVVNGTEYKDGTLVILNDIESVNFVFVKIEFIVCENVENPLLFVTVFDTLEFHERSFCYKIYKRVPFQSRLCD